MYRGIILQMGGQYKENSGQVARGFDMFSSKNAQRKGPARETCRTFLSYVSFCLADRSVLDLDVLLDEDFEIFLCEDVRDRISRVDFRDAALGDERDVLVTDAVEAVGDLHAVFHVTDGLDELLALFSLGVAVHNKGNASRPYMSTIIPRNNALPCSISDIFSTLRPDQKKIDLEILQGENMYADENEKLGQMEIKVPENTGHTQNVQVRFAYDINGVLVVDVTILSTGEKFSTVISQTMDQTELEKRVEYLNNLQLSEADEDKVITARLDSVYKSSDKQTQEQIRRMLVQYDMVKSSQESRSISRFRRMMLKSLDTFEKKNKAFDVFKLYEEYDNDDEE